MKVINYNVDSVYDLSWTNIVLEELEDSLIDEPRIRGMALKDKFDGKESGCLLIDVWIDKKSKKYRSGEYYPNFALNLNVLSYDENNFKAEWVLSDNADEEIGRFESDTTITYNEENDEYVYYVHEDIEKLTKQIVHAFDEYIDEQKKELVNLSDELIESYNYNVDDLFTYKDAIKIVKYIMDKFDISIEDLE